MKSRAILVSLLLVGVVTASAVAQSKAGKSTSSIRLMSSGRQVIVVPARATTLNGGTLTVQKAATLAGSSLTTQLAAAKAASLGMITSNGTVRTTGATTLALAPGQTVFIGATASRTNAGLANSDTIVVAAPATAAASSTSVNPLAATVERQIFAGDLIRDTTAASSGLTLGSEATTAGTVTTGPNGFPVFAGGTATAQSGTNPIGPNGFPQPATAGPQGGIQPIDTNGFPATNVAPFAQTGMTRSGPARDATTLPSAATTVTTTGVTVPALATPATAIGTTGASTASSSSASGSASPQ